MCRRTREGTEGRGSRGSKALQERPQEMELTEEYVPLHCDAPDDEELAALLTKLLADDANPQENRDVR